jgi:hypothetical protein
MFETLPKDLLINYFLIRLPSKSLFNLSRTNRYLYNLIFNEVAQKIHQILKRKYGSVNYPSITKPELTDYCSDCQCFVGWQYSNHKDHNCVKKYKNCSICETALTFSYAEISQFISSCSRIDDYYSNARFNKEDYNRIPNSIYYENPPKAIDYTKNPPAKCIECKNVMMDYLKDKDAHFEKNVYSFVGICGYSPLCKQCEDKKMCMKEPPIVNRFEFYPFSVNYYNMQFCYHCALKKNVTLQNFKLAQIQNRKTHINRYINQNLNI